MASLLLEAGQNLEVSQALGPFQEVSGTLKGEGVAAGSAWQSCKSL